MTKKRYLLFILLFIVETKSLLYIEEVIY